MHAEQVLVELKAIWAQLPGIGPTGRAPDPAMLGRIVSLLLDEYYAPD
jgi:hypothetical protein